MSQHIRLLSKYANTFNHKIYQPHFRRRNSTLIIRTQPSKTRTFPLTHRSKCASSTLSKDSVSSSSPAKAETGHHLSVVPSEDPSLLLSVRPYPRTEEHDKRRAENLQNLANQLGSQIPTTVMEEYSKWLKDRNSVEITWDSYFQHMLICALHGQICRTSPPIPNPPSTTLQDHSISTGDCNDGQSSEKGSCPLLQEGFQKTPSEHIIRSHLAVGHIIRSYQMHGHLEAKLDPLKITDKGINNDYEKHDYMPPELIVRKTLSNITPADMNCAFELPNFTYIGGKEKHLSLKEVIKRLEKTYCQNIGVEYMFINDPEKIDFIRQMFEIPGALEITEDMKKKILKRVAHAVLFEKYLATKWPGTKRFGLEGGEVLVAAMCQVIDEASYAGGESFFIGMAHRGRLNVLANVCGKPLQDIFSQFGKLELDHGSGDVKFHLGTHIQRRNEETDKQVTLTVLPNPSHLETVSPVVIGRTRSEQFFACDNGKKVMSILVHGDAAFSGQGVVYETIHLSKLPQYTSRGTIHFVINNQIGFTTDPRFSRSSTYCSDVGLVTQAPIFHVNGDNPEAVIKCCNAAVAYRNNFSRDVVIDIVCYRRYGHNETDDPSFTQPLTYKKINELSDIFENYAQNLIAEDIITCEEVNAIEDEYINLCEEEHKLSQKENKSVSKSWTDKDWSIFFKDQDPNKIPCTGVKEGVLKCVGLKVSSPPPARLNFELNKKLEKILGQRMELLREMTVDWSLAEAMAFGSLLMEGHHVRLSGEDVERGTFGHRHGIYHHQSKDKEIYMPLQNLSDNQGECTICNSSLCEYGIVGFELGYSMTNPNVLVMWEAQFGDFLNTAQTVIDCYLSSTEVKWDRQIGLVLLLPHGLEGAGPEHSSARMERFLQMCDDDPDEMPCLKDDESITKQIKDTNWIIVCPSTPANYFHVLRRQIKMPFRKPLILFTPKMMVKGNSLRSPLSEMSDGTEFQRVIPEKGPAVKNPKRVKRLIFCTGRVYYDLIKERGNRKLQDHIAITRIEQLCPFPYDLVKVEADNYPNSEICWVQEEHKNSGAWSYILPRFSTALLDCDREVLVYIGRPPAAAPATGNYEAHYKELRQLMNDALDLGFPSPDSSAVGRFWPAKT